MQDSYHKIERIHWIDFTRGLCMIVVVFYHTESYYIDVYHVFKYDWLSNFLKAFFFLSGYLLFKRGENHDSTYLIYKLNRILRSLIIPYFVFTLILAVPKCYAHGLDIGETLKIIIMGQASWFVTTLILTELCFISILHWCSKYKVLVLLLTSVLGLITAPYIDSITNNNPWCFQQALAAFIFLFLGYLYHQYEQHFRFFKQFYIVLLFFVLIIIMKVIADKYNMEVSIYPVNISNMLFFLIDAIIGIALIISFSQLISGSKLIEYTGKLSIIIYFLNGGVSVVTSKIMNHIGFGYDEQYYRVFIMFIVNYSIVLIISHIIYHYLPFMIGRNYLNMSSSSFK